MQRDYWYTAARAPGDLLTPARGRPHRRRAHGRAGSTRASSATLECPVLFEAPEAGDLHRLLRARGVGRQPLSQVVVPARFARATQVFAPHVNIREEPHLLRAPRQRAVRQRRRGDDSRATSLPTACCKGYFLGSYSARKLGLAIDRQRRRRHNLVVRARHRRSRRAAAQDGPRAVRHRAARAGRQSGDRRLFARRRGILDRGRRDRVSGRGDHDRRQPEATCSATSSRSARDVDRRGSRHIGSILVARMTIAGQLTPASIARDAGSMRGAMIEPALDVAALAQRSAAQFDADRRRWIAQLPAGDALAIQRRRSSSSRSFPARAREVGAGAGRGAADASTRGSSRSSRSSRSSTRPTTRRARRSSRGCGTRCSTSSRRSSPPTTPR